MPTGTKDDPWQLSTAPGTSTYTMWADDRSARDPALRAAIVVLKFPTIADFWVASSVTLVESPTNAGFPSAKCHRNASDNGGSPEFEEIEKGNEDSGQFACG
jgi:hypothetical protein